MITRSLISFYYPISFVSDGGKISRNRRDRAGTSPCAYDFKICGDVSKNEHAHVPPGVGTLEEGAWGETL
jgi:hypothetical protein